MVAVAHRQEVGDDDDQGYPNERLTRLQRVTTIMAFDPRGQLAQDELSFISSMRIVFERSRSCVCMFVPAFAHVHCFLEHGGCISLSGWYSWISNWEARLSL